MDEKISKVEIKSWAEMTLRDFEKFDVVQIDGDEKVVLCGTYASPYRLR